MTRAFFIPATLLILIVSCNSTENNNNNTSENTSEVIKNAESRVEEHHELYWHWEDEFSEENKIKLQTWIDSVTKATFLCLGTYPFDVHYYFHKSDGNEPVPFGHTSRKKEQSVHFYVNPKFSLEEFLADWTAPHEISHLSICFVGKRNMWFSEGYATYLSRLIMVDMGYFTPSEFDSIYRKKISNVMSYYNSSTSTFIQVSDSLLSHSRYGPVYAGGSSFFFTADQYLRKNMNMKFTDVITAYQKCCRLKDKSLKSLIESFDGVIGESYFSELMTKYRNSPSREVMVGY